MNSTTATSDKISNRDLGPPGSPPLSDAADRPSEYTPPEITLSEDQAGSIGLLVAKVNSEALASVPAIHTNPSPLLKLSLAYRWSLAKSLRISNTLRSKPGLIHFYEE